MQASQAQYWFLVLSVEHRDSLRLWIYHHIRLLIFSEESKSLHLHADDYKQKVSSTCRGTFFCGLVNFSAFLLLTFCQHLINWKMILQEFLFGTMYFSCLLKCMPLFWGVKYLTFNIWYVFFCSAVANKTWVYGICKSLHSVRTFLFLGISLLMKKSCDMCIVTTFLSSHKAEMSAMLDVESVPGSLRRNWFVFFTQRLPLFFFSRKIIISQKSQTIGNQCVWQHDGWVCHHECQKKWYPAPYLPISQCKWVLWRRSMAVVMSMCSDNEGHAAVVSASPVR